MPEKIASELPHFNDVIPDNLPDSTKSDLIIDIINLIEIDTTLIVKEYSDTSGKPVSAYYRNDTLVKIVTGIYTIPYLSNYAYDTYYFFMDTFICSRYECRVSQNTGRCNPVSASSKFYFYNDRIIDQVHENGIGQYGSCGCSDLSFTEKSDGILDYEKKVINEVARLKTIINYR